MKKIIKQILLNTYVHISGNVLIKNLMEQYAYINKNVTAIIKYYIL